MLMKKLLVGVNIGLIPTDAQLIFIVTVILITTLSPAQMGWRCVVKCTEN